MNIGKFVLNVVIAYIAYAVLYMGIGMLFPDQMNAGQVAMRPPEEIMVPTLAYHFVQTVVVVWLFGKAVGSGDLMAGAMFGFMIGLYLMATDSVWFASLKDFPQDGRVVLSLMNIGIGAIVGVLLAFLHSKGMGATGAAEEA